MLELVRDSGSTDWILLAKNFLAFVGNSPLVNIKLAISKFLVCSPLVHHAEILAPAHLDGIVVVALWIDKLLDDSRVLVEEAWVVKDGIQLLICQERELSFIFPFGLVNFDHLDEGRCDWEAPLVLLAEHLLHELLGGISPRFPLDLALLVGEIS